MQSISFVVLSYAVSLKQCAKKVVCDTPERVEFVIWLVNSVPVKFCLRE